jgi:hypothetical protein
VHRGLGQPPDHHHHHHQSPHHHHPTAPSPRTTPGAYYLRLTGRASDVYTYLEPLLNDFRWGGGGRGCMAAWLWVWLWLWLCVVLGV